MPRYNVEVDGKWACFTSISDGFITPFMPLEEYEKWRKEEYGKQCGSLERANKMTFQEAIEDMCIYLSDSEIVENLKELFGIKEMEE